MYLGRSIGFLCILVAHIVTFPCQMGPTIMVNTSFSFSGLHCQGHYSLFATWGLSTNSLKCPALMSLSSRFLRPYTVWYYALYPCGRHSSFWHPSATCRSLWLRAVYIDFYPLPHRYDPKGRYGSGSSCITRGGSYFQPTHSSISSSF